MLCVMASRNSMQGNVILSAVAAMMLLLLGTFSMRLEAWAQAQEPKQQKSLTQLSSSIATKVIRSKVTDIENTVKSALKSYAAAIDVRYIELESFNRTQIPLATSNNTGVAPVVVNQTAYADA
jgi:hypothetical protein